MLTQADRCALSTLLREQAVSMLLVEQGCCALSTRCCVSEALLLPRETTFLWAEGRWCCAAECMAQLLPNACRTQPLLLLLLPLLLPAAVPSTQSGAGQGLLPAACCCLTSPHHTTAAAAACLPLYPSTGTHKHVHVLVQLIAQHQVVCHGQPVRLHGVVGTKVVC